MINNFIRSYFLSAVVFVAIFYFLTNQSFAEFVFVAGVVGVCSYYLAGTTKKRSKCR